jgi:hypothetical protein
MNWFKRFVTNDDVVGVFDSKEAADLTRDELLKAGIAPEWIEIKGPQVAVRTIGTKPFETQTYPTWQIAEGSALIGGFIGGILGCLIGTIAATGAFRGIGPIVGAGAQAAIVGAIIGGGIGAILGAAIGWAISAEDLSFYARELSLGRTVVIVHHASRPAEALAILERHHASWIRAPKNMPVPQSP